MSKRKNRPNRCDPRQVGLRNAAEYMVKSSIIGALRMYVERYGEQLTEQREQSRTCSGSAESRRKKNEVQLTEQDINAFGLDGGREGEEKLPLRRRRGRGAAVEILRLRERRHRVGRRLGARPRPHRTAASKRGQSDACIDYAEVTEQREQTKVSLSVCRVATELAEGNVSRLDRQVNCCAPTSSTASSRS